MDPEIGLSWNDAEDFNAKARSRTGKLSDCEKSHRGIRRQETTAMSLIAGSPRLCVSASLRLCVNFRRHEIGQKRCSRVQPWAEYGNPLWDCAQNKNASP
jgi:hypothetical protein